MEAILSLRRRNCVLCCPLRRIMATNIQNLLSSVFHGQEVFGGRMRVDRFQVTRCPFSGRFQSACKRGGYEVTAAPTHLRKDVRGIFVASTHASSTLLVVLRKYNFVRRFYRRHLSTLHEAPLPPTVRERERAIHIPGPESKHEHEYEHHQSLLVIKGKQLFLDAASSRNYRHSR